MARQTPRYASRGSQSPSRRGNITSNHCSLSSSKEPNPQQHSASPDDDDDIPDFMNQSGFLTTSEITNEDGFNILMRSFERKNGSCPEKLYKQALKEGEIDREAQIGAAPEVKMSVEKAEGEKDEGEGKAKEGCGDDDWVLLEKDGMCSKKRLE